MFFINFFGIYSATSCFYFSATFGVESVVITDTTGGKVCSECSFYSFSTDTGCTVELISSDSSSIVQYTQTINKSGNSIAEGCVSGVIAGIYDIRVYDSSSSTLVHRVSNVTVLSLTTSTTTTKVFLPPTTSTTVANTSSKSQSKLQCIVVAECSHAYMYICIFYICIL